MASTIAAITTGIGGIVTTADATGNLSLLSGTSTVVAVTSAGAAVTGTMSVSGNVGIGTTSPGTKLQAIGIVKSGGTGTNGEFNLARTSDGLSVGKISLTESTQILDYNNLLGSGVHTFTINSAERMRIDSSGNLLVGCTAVPNVGATPDQFGFSVSSTEAVISKNTSGTTPAVYIKTIAGASKTVIAFYNGVNNPGNITTTPTATAYATSSDYRLKNTIAPMMGALAKVSQLKPCTYKWKVDGSDGEGFIAHELAEVVPQCVSGEKDATREEEYEVTPAVPAVVDAEGVETTPAVQAVKGTRTVPSYQGVDTSFLVATLTAAIQEAHALIIQLQADVAALKGVKV